MVGGSIPVDIVEEINETFLGRGSENWENSGVWERVHFFSWRWLWHDRRLQVDVIVWVRGLVFSKLATTKISVAALSTS